MQSLQDLRIDTTVELGVMFATVRASFVFGTKFVGAHVDLDGQVLGDIGLSETNIEGSVDGKWNGSVRALRHAAATAVMAAHRELHMEYTRAASVHTLELVARALPFSIEGIPVDYEVQPLYEGQEAVQVATCGNCGRSWDDGVSTSMTPAPSARCPFEAFHDYSEGCECDHGACPHQTYAEADPADDEEEDEPHGEWYVI